MAASFQWSESNGAGESVTDGIANLNFGSNDSANIVTTTYPVTAGQNSFEKYIRAKFGGTFTEISNMKLWKSGGAYITGESIKAIANQTYTAPVSSTSVKAVSDVPESEGTALSVQSTEGDTSKLTVSGTYTKYLVLQLQTTTSTPAGAVNQKTFTFQYDEV